MLPGRSGIKPGWYVLAAFVVFGVVAAIGWRGAVVELREARLVLAGRTPPVHTVAAAPDGRLAAELPGDVGLWFPIPGARVPSDDAHLPGAPRVYRNGTSEGFVFWPETAGVPIAFGTPVIAAASGEVIRADARYVELDAGTWEALIGSVAQGAAEDELDRLRGRQVWIRLDDGRILRYGHLSDVRAGLAVGQRVARGRVIGYVGNSGTFDGVMGRTGQVRLHFEVREGDGFVGQGMTPEDVRWLAASLFTGP